MRTGRFRPYAAPVGHYEVLGVTPDASMTEIKKAYLQAARDAHPDFHTESEVARLSAEDRMREINAAWSVLGDVDERSRYDRQRLRTERGQRPSGGFQASTTAGQTFRPFDDSEHDEDPFDELSVIGRSSRSSNGSSSSSLSSKGRKVCPAVVDAWNPPLGRCPRSARRRCWS